MLASLGVQFGRMSVQYGSCTSSRRQYCVGLRIFYQGISVFADQPNARRDPNIKKSLTLTQLSLKYFIDFKVVKILNIKFNNQINKWRILINILLSNLSP